MLRRLLLFILLPVFFVWGDDLRLHSGEPLSGPVLDYFTYLGGKSNERGTAVAIGPSGGIYVGGGTWSSNFPVVNAYQPLCDNKRKCTDAFLAKLDASGRQLLFSTFLDEWNVETVTDIAVDGQGDVYICAQHIGVLGGVSVGSNKASWPSRTYQPAGGFVARFNASGRQIYRTPLRSRGFSAPEGIAVDASGNVYITGWAPRDASHIGHRTSYHTFFSTERCRGGFSLLVGERDAFIIKLDPSGRVSREFFLGGSGDDAGYAIALDHAGNAYITGSTASVDIPGGALLKIPGTELTRKRDSDDTDLFVAKVDMANAKLLYTDIFGGRSKDVGYSIALDDEERIYVAGGTASDDFPAIRPIQGSLAGDVDAFVARLSNDGSRLAFSTFLGAGGYDVALDMALDGDSIAYLTGTTRSPDFPVLEAAIRKDGYKPGMNSSDAFIAVLDTKDDTLVTEGRFGGQKGDLATGIAVDRSGAVYVVGTTGSAKLGSGEVLRRSLAGKDDAFLVKFKGFGPLKPRGGATGDISRAGPDSMQFQVSNPIMAKDTVAPDITSGNSGGIDTYTQATVAGRSENVPILTAEIGDLEGIAVDERGNVYFSLAADNIVMKLDGKGNLTRVAGTGTFGFSGDNGPAIEAKLAHPWGLAVDSSGDLYIADSNNCRVRKISDGIIRTVAGNGCARFFFPDNGTATKVHIGIPHGIAVDFAGNLYFGEIERHRVRMVSNKGKITTVAGTGSHGYSGDNGDATKAQIWSPTGVAVDSAGNLFFSQRSRACVRKLKDGMITTVAGSGSLGINKDGIPAVAASIYQPEGIAVDTLGNLYIADVAYQCIRKVRNGLISTVAGNGIPGFSGDGGLAVNAQLDFPADVATDSVGNLYIADHDNYRIRKVTNGVITTLVRIQRKPTPRISGTYISPK